MRRLGDTVARLRAGRTSAPPISHSRLKRFAFNGSNPGALDAFFYAPPTPQGAPLVIVLHGCTQTAEAYDHGAGWSAHAEALGFALLFPQQRRANNPGLCFNWFAPDDVARDRGEAASIAAMILAMVQEHALDPDQVFITGLSAGGAMTAAMLATYPDLFAAGAVMAGLPFGAASTVPQAFEAMRGSGGSNSSESFNRVLRSSPGATRWPRVAIFHGAADATVAVANADRLVAQWIGVQGLSPAPTTDAVDGRCRHRSWSDATGVVLVEDYRIDGMGHGVPLDVGGRDPSGVAGPYMLEVGFPSTARLIETWGLGDPFVKRVGVSEPERGKGAGPPTTTHTSAPYRTAGQTPGVQAVIEDAFRRAGLLR